MAEQRARSGAAASDTETESGISKADAAKAAEAAEKGREEAQKLVAERIAMGYAAPLDRSDPRGREEREAEILDAVYGREAGTVSAEDKERLGSGSGSVTLESDAEKTRREDAMRSPLYGAEGAPSDPAATRSATINGVTVIVPTGSDVSGLPAEAAEILKRADERVRTAQMKGVAGHILDLRKGS